MSKNYQNHVGIDISKQHLDVCIYSTQQVFRLNNNVAGINQLVDYLVNIPDCLIIMESTGCYTKLVAQTLCLANFKVAIINPRQIRDFAKATGKLAKTDTIDASIIAHFAQVLEPEPNVSVEDKVASELNDVIQRRRQLVNMMTMEKNRLLQATGNLKIYIEKTLKFLGKQLEKIEQDTQKYIATNSEMVAKNKLLRTIKGVGPVVAATLIVNLPELGKINHKKIAALAGLAPFNWDSGLRQGKRFIQGGRADIKTILYMAAIVATRFNPAIKVFYSRLLAAGKPKKVALTACMRKLLIIMNAMLKNNTIWQERITS